jgi:hypothetical protein
MNDVLLSEIKNDLPSHGHYAHKPPPGPRTDLPPVREDGPPPPPATLAEKQKSEMKTAGTVRHTGM